MSNHVLTSSFFIFLASLGPLLPGVVAEAAPADAADVGELGLRLSLTLLACEADPGLRAEDDLSRGEIEVRCKRERDGHFQNGLSLLFSALSFTKTPQREWKRDQMSHRHRLWSAEGENNIAESAITAEEEGTEQTERGSAALRGGREKRCGRADADSLLFPESREENYMALLGFFPLLSLPSLLVRSPDSEFSSRKTKNGRQTTSSSGKE